MSRENDAKRPRRGHSPTSLTRRSSPPHPLPLPPSQRSGTLAVPAPVSAPTSSGHVQPYTTEPPSSIVGQPPPTTPTSTSHPYTPPLHRPTLPTLQHPHPPPHHPASAPPFASGPAPYGEVRHEYGHVSQPPRPGSDVPSTRPASTPGQPALADRQRAASASELALKMEHPSAGTPHGGFAPQVMDPPPNGPLPVHHPNGHPYSVPPQDQHFVQTVPPFPPNIPPPYPPPNYHHAGPTQFASQARGPGKRNSRAALVSGHSVDVRNLTNLGV